MVSVTSLNCDIIGQSWGEMHSSTPYYVISTIDTIHANNLKNLDNSKTWQIIKEVMSSEFFTAFVFNIMYAILSFYN